MASFAQNGSHCLPQSLPVPVLSVHANRLSPSPRDAKVTEIVNDHTKRIENDPERKVLCDFSFGNPQDPPSANFVHAVSTSLTPLTHDHYRYRTNEPGIRQPLAQSCAKRYSLPNLSAQDVFITTGNFAGLSLAIQLLVNSHENVIYMEPAWFFYERLILYAHAIPRRVDMPFHDNAKMPFDDDTQNIEHIEDMDVFLNAVDKNTKMIILNSPQNPTGKVYSKEWLKIFSSRLLDITRTRNSPVYVLADEAYSDYVFDGIKHESITSIYPYSLLAYTYNKMTLAPSQRAGYLLLSPLMPRREGLRDALFNLQMIMGWCFPNADMMESIPKLEEMRDSFDTSIISRRRDRMSQILADIGYELLTETKGTFYMLVRCPIEDDEKFYKILADQNITTLPGMAFQTPGCFRISLTATDEMIERCVNGFRRAFNLVKK